MRRITAFGTSFLAIFLFAPYAFADQIFAPQIKYYPDGETYPIEFRKDGSGPFPLTQTFSVQGPAGTITGTAHRTNTNPLAPFQSGQIYAADLKLIPGFSSQPEAAYSITFQNSSAPAITVKFSGNGNRELLEGFILGIRRWTFGTTEHWSGISYLADMMREVAGTASNHISVPGTPDRNGACIETLANGTTWCNPAFSTAGAQGIIGADGGDLRAYTPHAGLTASAYSNAFDILAANNYFGSTAPAISESSMLYQRYNYGRAFAGFIKPNGSAPFNVNQSANAPTNNAPSAPTSTSSDDPLANFTGFYTCTRNANLRLGLADLAMSLLSSSHAADQAMIDTLKAEANAIASFNQTCDDYSATADLETTLTAMKVNLGHWMLSGIQGSGISHTFNPGALNVSYQTALQNLANRLAQLQIIEGEAGPNSSGANGIYGYFAKTTNTPDIYYSAPLVRYYSLDAVGRIAQFVNQYSIGGTLGGTLKTIMERFIDGYVSRTTVIDPAAQAIAASPWHPWEIVRLDGTSEASAGGYTTVNLGTGGAAAKFRHYRPYSTDGGTPHTKSNEFAPGMALTLLDMAKALEPDPAQANRVHVARVAAEKLIYSMFGNNPLDKATVYGGTAIKGAVFARVGFALACYTSGYPTGCGSSGTNPSPLVNADHFFTQNGFGDVAHDFAVAGDYHSNERHEQKVAPTLGALAALYDLHPNFAPAGPSYSLAVTPASPAAGGQMTIALSTTLPGAHTGVVIANVSAAPPSGTPLQIIPTVSGPPAEIYIPAPWSVAAQGSFTASAPLVETYTLPAASAFSYPAGARLNLQAADYSNGQFATPPSLVWSAPILLGGFGGQAGALAGTSTNSLVLVLLVLVAVTSILAFVTLPKSRSKR